MTTRIETRTIIKPIIKDGQPVLEITDDDGTVSYSTQANIRMEAEGGEVIEAIFITHGQNDFVDYRKAVRLIVRYAQDAQEVWEYRRFNDRETPEQVAREMVARHLHLGNVVEDITVVDQHGKHPDGLLGTINTETFKYEEWEQEKVVRIEELDPRPKKRKTDKALRAMVIDGDGDLLCVYRSINATNTPKTVATAIYDDYFHQGAKVSRMEVVHMGENHKFDTIIAKIYDSNGGWV